MNLRPAKRNEAHNRLQGMVEISYSKIVEKLGPPQEVYGLTDQIQARWAFLVWEDTDFTIYALRDRQHALEGIMEWCIGGSKRGSYMAALIALGLQNKQWKPARKTVR